MNKGNGMRRGLVALIISLLAMSMVAVPAVLGATRYHERGLRDVPGAFGPSWFVNIFYGSVPNAAVVSSSGARITPQHGTQFAKMSDESGSNPIATVSQDFPVLPSGTITGYYWFIPGWC